VTRVPVRDDLRALEGYHSPQVTVKVRLNTNEAPGNPPDAFRDAYAAEMSRLDWNRYPDRAATELRVALAAHLHVRPDQVFAANGSNEILQTILLAFSGFGRTVATFEPTYQMHAQIARVCGATVAEGERRADFRLDIAEVRRVIASAQPAVTFLCSPNNPTGMLEDEATVRETLALTSGLATPGLLVVDEAYGQFAPWSALSMIDDDVPMVVTGTYSKTWSMAAARLGYMVGPSWLVEELDKVVLPYHLDSAKQIAGRVALRFVDDMNDRVAGIVAERERINAGLAELPITVWPSAANFILFRPETMPGNDVWQALLDRDVLVRNCSGWNRLDNCLRVTFGTPEENSIFLAALREVLS
jgi:histidinol-phosphate aminotransferase